MSDSEFRLAKEKAMGYAASNTQVQGGGGTSDDEAKAINDALADPQLRERLSGEALEPMPMTPEQFGKYMRDDIAKWTRVAKERNISIVD